ncbi:MAG: D-alanyl-D-alanine carboxypeptidase [Lachnospiraceae bacterium]|nr:D-alanyl-D-alanine carboxypeptidase [Lachnospiraceae bacterium]
MKGIGSIVLALWLFLVDCGVATATPVITSKSAILIEASTGQIVFESNSEEIRSPASITKIMTILLTFEALEAGQIALSDAVSVSAHASSMGGSQVWLEEGEVQKLETLLKCVIVASANDASVAIAEHIAGSETDFVGRMNDKAKELGMVNTHFEDCCGLTDSEQHHTTAKDVALMSRELITKYPQVFQYTTIWMEDFVHTTSKGESVFTLSSTNKLLKQYDWITGLKTGFTSKAMYCVSATGSKNGMDLIAVVMGGPDSATRFQEAAALLNYGYSVCQLYIDEQQDALPQVAVKGGKEDQVPLSYTENFRFLDTEKSDLSGIEKIIEVPKEVEAPVAKGSTAGYVVYKLDGKMLGRSTVVYGEDVEKATFKDIFWEILKNYCI